MTSIIHYASPLGGMLLAAEGGALTGAWFDGQRFFARGIARFEEVETPELAEARRWLDIYFSGKEPDFTPPLRLDGTDFQLAVWRLLLEIPYGETTTYAAIAKSIAAQKGLWGMSAQAVGGAVGKNPVSIIVPCHRVLGANGSMTGYAAGTQRKADLLRLEKNGSLL